MIGPEGENYGVIPFAEAMKKAEVHGLDLIEISPTANPPVAKIMNFGKYQYEEAKKAKAAKSKASVVELKTLQVKIGTGDHDLELKAKRASEWLKEGHRVKADLFLSGRAKYLDPNFLKERLNRILALISIDYKVADGPTKSPKGWTIILERGKGVAPVQVQKPKAPPAAPVHIAPVSPEKTA